MRFYHHDRLAEFVHPGLVEVTNAAVKAVQPGSRVLEVECESGRISAAISPVASSVIAVTLREHLYEMAKDRLSVAGVQNVDLRRGAAGKEIQGQKPFDVIRFGNIFYGLEEPAKFLRSFDAYLNPSGFFIAHSFLFGSSSTSKFFARFASRRGLKIRHIFEIDAFKKIFESSGYEVVSDATFAGVVPVGFLVAKKRPAGQKQFLRF